MPVGPGTTLGRYRLTERAGAGGMSEVWRAEDETLHRTVAVKVILQPIANDPEYAGRFIREARLVAGLEHPHILPVYDFGTADIDGRPVSYLVMPLVAGGSLKERITGPVPFPMAVAWLSAIAQALDHAHGKGILHRDVKPGNVLLDSGGRPLLADFGLARSQEAASGLTATGAVLGTPLYMAPEQATGKPLDGRADQYALAVIAFELLTGRVPFHADSPLAVLHQHVSTPPAAVSSILPGSPKEADAVLARALAKGPAERFPSCAAFVNALAGALGVPMSAATVPFVPGGLPRAGPEKPPSTSSGSQVATVLSKPAVPSRGPMAAPASRPPPEPGSTRTSKRVLAGIAVAVALGLGLLLVLRRPARTPERPSPTPLPRSTAAPTAEPAGAPTALPISEPTAIAVVPTAVPPPVATAAEPKAVPAAPPIDTLRDRRRFRREARRETVAGSRASDEGPRLRREPLLAGGGRSADTELSAALAALDTTRKPDGRLGRADFVEAMGGARSVLARRSTPQARLLDSFARAGVAFADGNDATAWQLLQQAFQEDHVGLTRTRTLIFVRQMALELSRNPGRDGQWVMGLAFADVRGDVVDELARAGERAPDSATVAMARALHSLQTGHTVDAARYARQACDRGWVEACGMAR